MENLADIIKRLRDTRPVNGDSANGFIYDEPPEDACPLCEGRKWIALDVPVGHPDLGKVVPCECQGDAMTSERSSRLRRYSNLGPLSRMTFESFDPKGRSSDPESSRLFASAYEAAMAYAEEPAGWLTLTGPNGSGKTHLAAAIANRCIERGAPAFFVHVPDLLDDLRSTYAPASEFSYSELFDQVNDAELLILDGLGAQSATPWAQEKLQQIFNRRSNSRLPTVVTTAMNVGELDPYVSSRMTDPELGLVLELRNHDRTPAKKFGAVPFEMLERMTFDSFDTRGNRGSASQRASLEAALKAARDYVADPDGWLTLFGETGVGKTHLAVAIAVERMRQGRPVFFAFVPEFIDYLRYTFQPDSGVGYVQVFDEVRNAPMLILDDLGGEYRSDWAYEKLYQVIVHRHNLRMPTVITSPMDITDMTGPINSRIRDDSVGGLTRIDAPDYRVNQRGGSRRGTPERGRGPAGRR